MKRWIGFGGIAAVLVANALWFYSTLGWNAVDDAYISYVYAQNAIFGLGLTFSPSERVEGFSNFMWTAMMVPIVGAGWDVGRVSSALGVAFGIGVLALVVRLPRWLGVSAVIGWMAALFLAADGSFALWSVSGLETSMFAFLIVLAGVLYLRENFTRTRVRKTRHGEQGTRLDTIPLSGIVFGLAAMTRPEAAAVLALTVAHQAAWRLIDERKLVTRKDLIRVGSFAAIFIPYWVLRAYYYRSLLPNSFYAKVAAGGPIAQIDRGLNHVNQFVGVHLGWLILLPAVVALAVVTVRYIQLRRERRKTGDAQNAGGTRNAPSISGGGEFVTGASAGELSVGSAEAPPHRRRTMPRRRPFFGLTYFAAVVVMYVAYIIYVGGDWSVGRFFVPILPYAYILIAAGLYWIVRFLVRWIAPNGTSAAPFAMGLSVVLSIALWYASAYNGEFRIFIGGFDAGLATEARITAGKWLKQNVPPGTWIAVDAAGEVPYFSELPAIDMFGINDLHIGRMPVPTLGQGTPGHEKFDLGYIITRAPKYVVIYGNLFDSVKEYKRANVHWTDNPALEQFLTIYERR